jgi:uncharacterized lipoprotein YmbA
MKLRSPLPPGLLVLAIGLATGCTVIPPAQPDLTRYFVLTSTTAAAKPADAAGAAPRWKVALRPVEVPGFLRGKAMQVRVAGNEIQFAEDARWAEPLEAGLGRVLREGLERRGDAVHVVATDGEDPEFAFVVRVLRCEGDREAKVARFAAVVEVYGPRPGTDRLARDTFTVEVPNWDGSYSQLAQKLSEAVEGLAERMVTLLATAGKR